MRDLGYNEPIRHQTGDLPLAYYYVDEHHPRYSMRMHWHRETEFVLMRQGTLRLYVDDLPMTLTEGDWVVIGGGALHGGDAENGIYDCVVFDPLALMAHTDPCRTALKQTLGRTLLLPGALSDPALSGGLNRLTAAVRAGAAANPLCTVGALYELFGALAGRAEAAVVPPSERSVARSEPLKPALEYIETNYGAHITLEHLARLTGMSPKYFCRLFRAVMHRSPIDYLNHYRIECASFLLTSSDMTVAEIAQRCGFSDSSFFIRQFRHYKNTTPRRYRAAG